ncbi:MAG: hypothetical protein KatS3mg110_3307 [Pirellulaceae bacterium]|nr:MAG: hypothetical protein KatS3mg110_3307 [Pirellulaceae bacterium]
MRCRRGFLLVSFVALTMAIACATPAMEAREDDAIRVLSFNIRYGTAPDRENAWPARRELVFQVLRNTQWDFVGLQEALRFQLDEIQAATGGLGVIGVGRDDGEQAGEYSAILYRRDRWFAQQSGTFWLSDTPDPYRIGGGWREPNRLIFLLGSISRRRVCHLCRESAGTFQEGRHSRGPALAGEDGRDENTMR